MPEKRFKTEKIVVLLRQIEVLMSQGQAVPLLYGLSIFAANYVWESPLRSTGGWRSTPFWGFVPAMIGGALAGFVVARQGMLARPDFQARRPAEV
jgi:hypothetical protein